MATYFIGDVHGHYDVLITLLKKIQFTPGKDVLWLTGDLVFRGPKSLEVLRYVKSLGKSVRVVLGNHDLNLLAVYVGIQKSRREDDISPILKANDVDELLTWLRSQPVLRIDEKRKILMVHAGIYPRWNLSTTKAYARLLEKALINKDNSRLSFLNNSVGKDIKNYHIKNSNKIEKHLQFISNTFTRMRYCFLNGKLELSCKESPENAPKIIKPWFSISRCITQQYSIVFGHWSSLKEKKLPDKIYAIDTGCCWGGKLTCLRWEDKTYFSLSC